MTDATLRTVVRCSHDATFARAAEAGGGVRAEVDPVRSRHVDGNTGSTLQDVLSTGLDQQGGGGVRLVCRTCGYLITSARARFEVGGAHEHRKTNPAGVTFHIGCFWHAPGAKGWGVAFAEHSWFAGYTGRIALCAGCDNHLGWAFEATGDRFYGLILDRLRSEDEGERGPGA